MNNPARKFFDEYIEKHALFSEGIIDCDVFGTLLSNFSGEPESLNINLMQALQWLEKQRYDVRIVSSEPEVAERHLRSAGFDERFFPVYNKVDIANIETESPIALRIDDRDVFNNSPQYSKVIKPDNPDFLAFLDAFPGLQHGPDPKDVKRMIIIDDDFTRYNDPNNIFQGASIPVELGYARYSGEAIKIIDEWIDQGYAIDAISFDDNEYGHGQSSWDALPAIMKHIEKRGREYLPKGLFVHSKANASIPRSEWGEIHRLSTQEFIEMANIGEANIDDPIFGPCVSRNMKRDYYHTKFRAYCNEYWGTDFALSNHEASFRNEKDKKISHSDLHNLLFEKVAEPEDLFDRLDIETIFANGDEQRRNLSSRGSDWDYAGINFVNATGGAVSGRLAFSEQDIEAIREDNVSDSIVLCIEEYSPDVIHLLKNVEGVILLGEGSEHFKLILDNAGISGVFKVGGERENAQPSASLTIVDNKLLFQNKKYNHETDSFIDLSKELNPGDNVSFSVETWITTRDDPKTGEPIEATYSNGVFYPVAMAYEENWMLWEKASKNEAVVAANSLRKRYSDLDVVTNADTPEQIEQAINLGADGVGLIRSEHMFYEKDRLQLLQSVMVAPTNVERQPFLDVLETMHAQNIKERLEVAQQADRDFPLTYRLLDAPLDEFLVTTQKDKVYERIQPGQDRGVQFAMQTPGLYEMQANALFQAIREQNYNDVIRVMVPNVRTSEEVIAIKEMLINTSQGQKFEFGSMIENVEAVHNIEDIAKQCDFISFGTNDLTADVMGGISRIDYDGITNWMFENDVRGESPFRQIIPQVQKQIERAVFGARRVNPNIFISGCGAQMALDKEAVQLALSLQFNSISVPNTHIFTTHIASGYHANAQRDKINTKDSPPEEIRTAKHLHHRL